MSLICSKDPVEGGANLKPWSSLSGKLPRWYAQSSPDGGYGLLVGNECFWKTFDLNAETCRPEFEKTQRILRTKRGDIRLPAFLPVTTFDHRKFPLDSLLQPYFKRYVDAVMVSYHYARTMKTRLELPTFIDSGGFVSLFEGTRILDRGDYVVIETPTGDTLHPQAILERQFEFADIAVSLDILIPPRAPLAECQARQDYTVKNALYALHLWREKAEPRPLLFAGLQAWDAESARAIMDQLTPHPFHGFAVGGMVPRASKPQEIIDIVKAIRSVDAERPLHIFGLGTPAIVKILFQHGVDSVDSNNFIRHGISGASLDYETGTYRSSESFLQGENLRSIDSNPLATVGEIGNMSRVLANLGDSLRYLDLHARESGHDRSGQAPLHPLKGQAFLGSPQGETLANRCGKTQQR